ncbi:Pyridoxal phosphate-dependent transferase, major domain protein [Teratosphaeria destructans]|uniref:Pyridoxal phosphate-dependent transferase, major domain protein n=1 Tax=Teratosphaeria destructans TaxID=418781 RepID=A0A9W7SPS5_9PEZI|nr:Pyridoxal phosphate-dependent transferase, major domain protein [Teratosphaeria destructans]
MASSINSAVSREEQAKFSPEPDQKYSFLDDYSEGAHPQLLQALVASNQFQASGYSRDIYSDEARRYMRRHLGCQNAGVFFVPSGTAANAISIAACLRPYESVIAAMSAHIITREAGAIEARGHKIHNVPSADGKLTPAMIKKAVTENWHYPHMARPRLVYISNATEYGTVYTKTELQAIRVLCTEHDLLLFVDGARIGMALTSPSNDLTLSDMLRLTDIFWIGGTKNGALLGEAIVVNAVRHPRLAADFEFYIKQNGGLLAKNRIIGVQFAELFRENLFFDLARAANDAAERLSRCVVAAGFELHATTQTNQVFAILPMYVVRRLQEHFLFYVWEMLDKDRAVVRLLTSWATDPEEMGKFAAIVTKCSTLGKL